MPSYKEKTPTLVNNLVPNPTPEKTRNTTQNKKEGKTEEDRRMMIELLDEENDLNYYSDADSDYGYFCNE